MLVRWTWLIVGLLAVTGVAGAGDPPDARQPTANRIVNQFQKNGGVFPGRRRNHAKGVCVSGYFASSGAAARYSTAQVFAPGERTPVIGRLSIPGTNPYAWDDGTPIRGMALDFLQADGRQWRTAMNAVPAFPVATPAENYEFLQAQQPVVATGEPDPKKLAAFFALHPKANAFRIWDQTTPPSASYATVRYNSLDAFYFVDAHGQRQAVRWSMVPQAAADDHAAPADASDFLESDLRKRLAHAPLKWRLIVTLAAPGDAIDDASVAWPAERPHVDAGTLVIVSSQPQRIGVCRDISFDPLVLPRGIEPSADPLLQDRAATYAESLRRRLQDRRADVPAPAATSHP
ncbi:MAG: Catalase [Rhodanobacteraceae bacterium]|jgi:catalase|nr:MAG: Catalase [Rhodanobacteraceae bacterium]